MGHTNLVPAATALCGGQAISGSRDNTLKVWDVQSGKCLQTLWGHTNDTNSVAVCIVGRWSVDLLITPSRCGTFRVSMPQHPCLVVGRWSAGLWIKPSRCGMDRAANALKPFRGTQILFRLLQHCEVG